MWWGLVLPLCASLQMFWGSSPSECQWDGHMEEVLVLLLSRMISEVLSMVSYYAVVLLDTQIRLTGVSCILDF